MKKGRRPKEGGTTFAAVHTLVRSIPRGQVATYGQLSEMMARRLTPIGIGWALRTCDAGVPWYRVINSQGGISTDRETPGRQRALLEAEGVRFRPDGTVDLAAHRWSGRATRGASSGKYSRRGS